MDWMRPDIAIILATIVIIFLIFLRVGRQLQVRDTFFQLWVVSWLFSIIHYVGQFVGVLANEEWASLLAVLFLAYSGITFVAAAQSLRGRSFTKMLPYCLATAAVLSVWAYIDSYGFLPRIIKWMPFEGALALLFGLAGVSHYLHQRKQSTIGGAILSYTFLFWSGCFVAFAIWGDSPFFAKYTAYLYQFSNLPKPVAAIGMLIFLIECQKMKEQRQRDFAESLIENAPDGIFILDGSGKITRANKRFEEISGLCSSDLLGKPISAVIQPSRVEPESAAAPSGDWDGSNGSQPKTAVTVHGLRDVLVTSEPILNADANVGSMGIVKDITDRLQLEQQLVQAEKMASIGLMVSGVAHELNNPLTSVIGFTELALREASVPRGTAERLKIVLSEARRTRGIVQKLLSAIRQQKSERSPVRVNQIVRDTVALREHDFRLNNIEIVTDLDPKSPSVMGDASDLQQVLINLMQNAFDALREDPIAGRLEIHTTASEGWVSIEVSDDGPGLADAVRVFDPFYTTKEVGKGTGLG
ncbi:MAG: PAS domain S-box protein, partial [Blastocatellia bacterium]